MFSFFKKKHIRIDDRIFINRREADFGFFNEVNKLRLDGTVIFILCFFEKTIGRLQPLFSNSNFIIQNAKNIKKDFVNNNLRKSIQQKQNPIFLFAEHHPHFDYELSIVTEIEGLCEGNNSSIGFFASLDEPLFQQFGSQKIIELMKSLGIKENEAISHSIVTTSVVNAQKKIAKKVNDPSEAKSQEEWFSINLPN